MEHPLRLALAMERDMEAYVDRLINELHKGGVTWDDLAELSGMTVSSLRWRARRVQPQKSAPKSTKPRAKTVTQQQEAPSVIEGKQWALELWSKADDALKRSPTQYGPETRRGFTLALLDLLPGNPVDGHWQFTDLTGELAGRVLDCLPPGNLRQTFVDGAPMTTTLLKAARDHGGKVSLAGFIAPPSDPCERFVIESVMVTADTGDPRKAKFEAARMKVTDKGTKPPSSVMRSNDGWELKWGAVRTTRPTGSPRNGSRGAAPSR